MRKYYKLFEDQAKFWMAELSKYNEGPFAKVPENQSRSIGQIYTSMMDHSFETILPAIEKCLANTGAANGGKSFRGRLSFMRNNLSQSSTKTKFQEKNPSKQPENIMAVRDRIIKLMKEMSELYPRVENAPKSSKIKHDELGMLNAQEWYRLVELDFKYHLRFKQKIDQYFINGK